MSAAKDIYDSLTIYLSPIFSDFDFGKLFSRSWNAGGQPFDGSTVEVTPQRNRIMGVYLGLSITGGVVDVSLGLRRGVVGNISCRRHQF